MKWNTKTILTIITLLLINTTLSVAYINITNTNPANGAEIKLGTQIFFNTTVLSNTSLSTCYINFTNPTGTNQYKTSLEMQIIANTTTTEEINTTILNNINTILWSTFDPGETTTTTANNRMNYTGRVNGVNYYATNLSTNGKWGGTINFTANGTQYIQYAGLSTNAGDKARFISHWIKPNSVMNSSLLYNATLHTSVLYWAGILYIGSSTSSCVNEVLTMATDTNLGAAYGRNCYINSSWNFQKDTWYMISLNWNETGTKYEFYIDGYPVPTTEVETGTQYPINITSLRIGIASVGGINYPFNGSIDEVIIMNISLTPEEILKIYNNQLNTSYAKNTTIPLNISRCIGSQILTTTGTWETNYSATSTTGENSQPDYYLTITQPEDTSILVILELYLIYALLWKKKEKTSKITAGILILATGSILTYTQYNTDATYQYIIMALGLIATTTAIFSEK